MVWLRYTVSGCSAKLHLFHAPNAEPKLKEENGWAFSVQYTEGRGKQFITNYQAHAQLIGVGS